ncbi:glycosyltransferase family 2 protein [Pseudofulvibacter geojedonensis]|uniref:Glycosyltransferase family 2 protein n=1 Tax=Pseudofulvibacter geojedonensis TaxID=1123758 RepID=A0ABW3I4F2_9FLAO
MNYYIVIPAHNEAKYISSTLDSILSQTVLPKQVIVVNDNSTDNTANIIGGYVEKHSFISLVNNLSTNQHLPGSKVIQAFNKGLKKLDDDFDFIVKLDADIILPNNYFETLINHFQLDDKIGMVGGFAYIEKDGKWVLENLTNKDHIRGAFKAYRKQCFKDIGQLKTSMGWDTVDELLAQYYDWKIKTDESLKVKHLKPTGKTYNKTARYKQGEAFYKLGYGFTLTCIAGIKLALLKKKPFLFFDYLKGFFKAEKSRTEKLVSQQEERFIRRLRWRGIKHKLGL